MYNTTALPRSPEQHPNSSPHYSPRNPYPRQEPSNQPPYHDHRGQPPSPSTSSLPALNGYSPHSRTKSASTFYDPIAENGDRQQSWNRGGYPGHSPNQVNRVPASSPRHEAWREPARMPPRSPPNSYADPARRGYAYSDGRGERAAAEKEYSSPGVQHRPHPSPSYPNPSYPRAAIPADHQSYSPSSSRTYHNHAMPPLQPAPSFQEPPPPRAAPGRTADPMSFSNILSTSDAEPERPASPIARPSIHAPPPAQDSLKAPHHHEPVQLKMEPTANNLNISNYEADPATSNAINVIQDPMVPRAADPSHTSGHMKTSDTGKRPSDVDMESIPQAPLRPSKAVRLLYSEKEIEAALLHIESSDRSDIENSSFDIHVEEYFGYRKKRLRDADDSEELQRKRRRVLNMKKLADLFDRQAQAAKRRFRDTHEQGMLQEVQHQEIADEKERKKDMQRKRRREKTLMTEKQKSADAAKKAREATDRAEKEKFIREMQRAEKKASATTKLLKGEFPNDDLRELTPHGPNLEGGTMSSFQTVDDLPSELPKKRPRTGGRLKKSKEQKQQEKDNAAAAHAAMERDDLVTIAPKESRSDALKGEHGLRDSDHASAYTSKAYNQLYDSIWKDIARKDIPRLYRIKDASTSTKQSNLRKTAILASKEARKWQTKTNKSMKDNQARAKRVMREMLSFWKRNEREERDQRKMAEKAELENAKKAEADREANRQKRKLNFLISQTELYSHFIGKKVKTDEVERSTDGVVAVNETIQPAPGAPALDLPDDVGKGAKKVTNFEDLDFDADDDTALQEAAIANAQNAIQEAQDRARAFNNDGQLQSQFDDGEMNFQNPTSLQTMDVAQPRMLTCQLKEYQLKGLNWLVNLYEQGINGILADEMGLGKTVQSISVMGYLAEVHNIWGPFLVIAPASTLHNWQQEFTRFVPDLTVLPYWGNAKDRKVLRKFWDRKHITYNRDSPFHVLVTSYQLVVQDAQYFQKIRWQYMVLDEAQAIKSSSSSRWKSLLGFHCRNRLLLTGTPIQNNMQELWALLHFIMPSLFDSHDEFSDWFSKDIESHAQSNTKLNEDQLRRLHMILKPFMLRRIKKHVQKELGDKIELDVFCDLTYRQRAYYANLRNKISIMDLIEKASVGDDQDAATLMNLVMQFRKVCNHPDLFERAETTSPVSFSYFAETASFMREGYQIEVGYSVRNLIEYKLPKLIGRDGGRLDIAGADNDVAGWRKRWLYHVFNIWTPQNIQKSTSGSDAFSWLRFIDSSPAELSSVARKDVFQRAFDALTFPAPSHDEDRLTALFNIVDDKNNVQSPTTSTGYMHELLNVSRKVFYETGMNAIEPCSRPAVSAPPIELYCASRGAIVEKQQTFFNTEMRIPFNGIEERTEQAVLDSGLDPALFPSNSLIPRPISEKARYTRIQVPSMRRFVTDSGKLAKLDQLLGELKEGGHRVLLYFQMTRMIDLMEEYLTYRNYKYCRLDGSTKLEDRRDTVADFQNRSDIFIFLLSTRAGGLGINLTAADTVIFYDSDWNPTIDSQAMDRAHRLGQTKQVTVYRLITRSTIEERIRKRALQKEEVQRVVISGGAGAQVDFNTRSRENRTKDIAMWLADDDQAAEIEKKEAELAEREAREPPKKGRKQYVRKRPDVTLDDMYHEGEGHFDDNSNKPSGAATPVEGGAGGAGPAKGRRKGISKKAKSIREKLAIADGGV